MIVAETIEPPLPHRPSTSCPNHPSEHFTGFCPSCLCERLAVLDQTNAVSRKPSAALRALRRTKSFSASKNSGESLFSGSLEPQRKSCDVRGRSTLWNLFSLDHNAAMAEEEEEEVRVRVRVSNATNSSSNVNNPVEEITEEVFELKDLDSSQTKRRDLKKDISGSFWSVFSKKLQKWRLKKLQRMKKRSAASSLPVEKPIGTQFRETQSEIADYGFGRRSCDTDPRFSLDFPAAGRMSLDADPRFSFDEPRASWDGYLVGKTFPRVPLPTTMLSVVEDVTATPPVAVVRSDAYIPVEEPEPGGTAQTRDYYSEPVSRRPRRSLDRSSSVRKNVAVNEVDDEMKSTSNSNSNHSNTGSLREEYSEVNEATKKSRRWTWNIWGLIHRGGRSNGVVERSFSETFVRSNSNVSWRSSSMRNGAKKKEEPVVMERNRSARFSPGGVDNGLLRFYLTSNSGRRTGVTGKGRYKYNHAHSIARSVLRLY